MQKVRTRLQSGAPLETDAFYCSPLSINPHISVRAVIEAFTNSNALQLASSHDLILDCTDNPSTRYLISDAAVLADKMLVSAAAQGYEGQIAVWNRYLDPRDCAVADTAAAAAATRSAASPSDLRESRLASSRGPCYRCVFPEPPRPADVVDCSEGGVLGCITGLVGTMQAVEAIRILARIGEEFSESALQAAEAEAMAAKEAAAGPSDQPATTAKPKAAGIMTLIAPITSPLQPFRSVRLRPRRLATCVSCGDPTDEALRSRLILDLAAQHHAAFCGLKAPPANAAEDSTVQRIDPSSLPADDDEKAQQEFSTQRLLVDVRPKVEFGIASLSHSYSEYDSTNTARATDSDPSSSVLAPCRPAHRHDPTFARLGARADPGAGGPDRSHWSSGAAAADDRGLCLPPRQ